MFAVIYRSYLLPGKDARYQELWHKIAEYFVAERGAIDRLYIKPKMVIT